MLLKRCLIFRKVRYLIGQEELKRIVMKRSKPLGKSCGICSLYGMCSVCIRYIVFGRVKVIMEYCGSFDRVYYVSKESNNI